VNTYQQDLVKAILCYSAAYEIIDSPREVAIVAAKNMAMIFVDGNVKESMKWCKVAADLGEVESMSIVGLHFAKRKDSKNAIKYLTKAANSGYVKAQHNLAIFYLKNESSVLGITEKSRASNFLKWFKTVAKNGNADSLFELGIAYLEGESVRKDFERGKIYLEQAAKQDNPSAKMLLLQLSGWRDMELDDNKRNVREHYILYLDILGYQSNIEKHGENWYLKLMDNFLSGVIEGAQSGMQLKNPLFANKKITPQVKIFSDNIIIAVEKMAKEEDNLIVVQFLMELASDIQYTGIANVDIVIRGSFSCGPLHISDKYVFGSGLINAYLLEEKKAGYPRIVVCMDMVNDLKKYFDLDNCCYKGIDNYWAIDYLALKFEANKEVFNNEIIQRMIMFHKLKIAKCIQASVRNLDSDKKWTYGKFELHPVGLNSKVYAVKDKFDKWHGITIYLWRSIWINSDWMIRT